MSAPPRLGPTRVRLELGLLAFAPALAMVAFRARSQSWWWLCFAVPAILGCVVAMVAAVVLQRANGEPYEFEEIEDLGGEMISHVGTYLIAVVVDFSKSIEEVVIAGLGLALIVQIHVATGRVYVSPLLYLFGRRTYRATTKEKNATYYLIARTDPSEWKGTRRCAALGSSILIEKA